MGSLPSDDEEFTSDLQSEWCRSYTPSADVSVFESSSGISGHNGPAAAPSASCSCCDAPPGATFGLLGAQHASQVQHAESILLKFSMLNAEFSMEFTMLIQHGSMEFTMLNSAWKHGVHHAEFSMVIGAFSMLN
ncbi:hypothetical protein Cni_G02180 [Canna indica]|uniref:Uncharacterized protein n=1 Tax=Canna indica TaxID=4628 RepID=A0AAQ3JQI4_9LILI|nr:hypothetical protein Cni_G02180 [Canna indica]